MVEDAIGGYPPASLATAPPRVDRDEKAKGSEVSFRASLLVLLLVAVQSDNTTLLSGG